MTTSGRTPAPGELRVDVRGVAEQRDRQRPRGARGPSSAQRERLVERRRDAVDVAEPQPPLDALAIDLDEEARRRRSW